MSMSSSQVDPLCQRPNHETPNQRAWLRKSGDSNILKLPELCLGPKEFLACHRFEKGTICQLYNIIKIHKEWVHSACSKSCANVCNFVYLNWVTAVGHCSCLAQIYSWLGEPHLRSCLENLEIFDSPTVDQPWFCEVLAWPTWLCCLWEQAPCSKAVHQLLQEVRWRQASRDHRSCLQRYTELVSQHHKIHCAGELITRKPTRLAVSTGTSQSSRAPGKAPNCRQKWETNQLRTPRSCSMTLSQANLFSKPQRAELGQTSTENVLSMVGRPSGMMRS